MKKQKVIVIGANHAGTTALRALVRMNPDLEVVTYDKNNNISFLGCGIALWVQGEFKDPKGLFYADPDLLRQEKINVFMRHEVTALNATQHEISITNLETGKKFIDHYDKLILAVGSWPIIPPIPNIDLKGIEIVKWFQHAQRIKEIHQDPALKKITIIGAGYIGVELAHAFNTAGKETTLLDFLDRVMPNYYDKEFTDKIEASMREKGVHVRTGESVKSFKGDADGNVTHVITSKGEIETDRVILCVGFNPDTKMLKGQLELSSLNRGAIVVDQTMKTSNDDIYAVGDCIEVFNNALGTKAFIALATTAVRSGMIAASYVAKGCDSGIESIGFQGSNAICVFDWNLASTGVSEVVAQRFKIDYEKVFLEDNDCPEFMHNATPVMCKILWNKKNRKIIGAQVASQKNHTETMYFFSLAILKGLTIDELPLVDLFFLPHFNKPYNFITRSGLKALNIDWNKNFEF